jgi:hypothetical protein
MSILCLRSFFFLIGRAFALSVFSLVRDTLSTWVAVIQNTEAQRLEYCHDCHLALINFRKGTTYSMPIAHTCNLCTIMYCRVRGNPTLTLPFCTTFGISLKQCTSDYFWEKNVEPLQWLLQENTSRMSLMGHGPTNLYRKENGAF